jgi:signal transduction histidine kinase/ligand-binding sensor domain-containing protein
MLLLRSGFIRFVFIHLLLFNTYSSLTVIGGLADRMIFDKILPEGSSSFGIIEDIQQDSSGFIWIAAKDGLFRYDGIKFKAYLFDRRNSRSISNNVITDLYFTREGKLWVGTENGLNLYDQEFDAFTRYFCNPEDQSTLSANHVVRMTEDKEGSLWIATADGGLSQFISKTKTFKRYTTSNSQGLKITSNFLRTVFTDKQGILWVGTIDKGAFGFMPGENNLKILTPGQPDGEHIAGASIRCIVEFPEGRIWFGSGSNGLSCYDKSSGTFSYFSTLSNKNYINCDAIWNLYVDSQKILWVCTDGGGLNRFDIARNIFSAYTNNLKNPGSISSDVVRVFYEDHAGNYWIGNFNAPLNYVDNHPKKFRLIRSSEAKEIEQGINKVTSILKSRDNTLWIGTDGAGLLAMDAEGQTLEKYVHRSGDNYSIANNKPLCLEEDADGNIWVGTYEGGLSCFLNREKSFRNFYPDGTNKNPRGTQIWDLMMDSNELWIASEKGVDILNLKTQEFTFIPVDKMGGRGTNVAGAWYIFKDSQNRILIGTIYGMNVYDRREKHFTYYEPAVNDTSSISDKWVLTIFEDSHKRIWVGTNGGGLNLWKEPNHFVCFNTDQGLPGNVINGILEDSTGALWISTNKGLAKFEYEKQKVTVYDINEGIQDNRFNINAAYNDCNGNLYFGGINGLTYFNPNEIFGNPYTPPVVLTGFELFNKPVNILDPKSPVQKNIICQNEIHLSHKQMVFTIRFASLNYTQPAENKYKYLLEGFEKEWNEVGNQNWATYTNLPSGKYIFRVLGSNNDNHWSPVGTSIKIIVHPPFYRTIWFILLLILAGVIVILTIYRLRVREMRLHNKKLSLQVAARTQELENRNLELIRQRDIATTQRDQISLQNEELEKHRNQLEELIKERTADLAAEKQKAEDSDKLKTAFLENLSHQIRTPMNAILGFINLLSEKIEDKDSREYYLRIINDSGRSMLHLVEDIIDFSRMQMGQLHIECSECNIQQTVRDLVSGFRAKAAREKPNLNITMDFPTTDTLIVTDERKLMQILVKLLENSYKYTESGQIRVGIKEITEEYITFSVDDTGIGIEEKYLHNIFDHLFFFPELDKTKPTRGTGIGLAFAKTVTELLGGKIWAESNSSGGIHFLFSLPYARSANLKESQSVIMAELNYSWPEKLIVVAEDEDSNYLLIEAMLRDTGAKLIRAHDGINLLEIVESESEIDLVLLDIQMPRLNGINAMQIIRDSNRKIPVIAQTAFDQAEYRNLCKEQGFAGFIVKPIRKLELLNAIKQCLG